MINATNLDAHARFRWPCSVFVFCWFFFFFFCVYIVDVHARKVCLNLLDSKLDLGLFPCGVPVSNVNRIDEMFENFWTPVEFVHISKSYIICFWFVFITRCCFLLFGLFATNFISSLDMRMAIFALFIAVYITIFFNSYLVVGMVLYCIQLLFVLCNN